MLTALIPIVTTLLPKLIPLFATPAAGNILIKASEIAGRLLGTTDPSQIEAMLKSDAQATERFKAELESATASEVAWLADVQSARNMQMEAIKAGSKTQWIPVILTAGIFFLFGLAFYLSVEEQVKPHNVAAQQIIGALIAAFATVIGYWFGSSRGSAGKDSVLAAITSGAVATQGATAQQAVQSGNGTAAGRMFR